MFSKTDPSSPGHYGRHRTALLLLDFHTMFVTKAAESRGADAVSVAASLRSWALAQGIYTIHCLVDLSAAPFESCKDAAKLEAIIKSMREDGSGDEWRELGRDMGDMDVTFTRRPGLVSALRSPGLESFLESKGIKSLLLAGLSTSGCVMRTAICASDAEYVVTVISDGCADADQEVHDTVIQKLINRGYTCTGAEFKEGYEAVQSQR